MAMVWRGCFIWMTEAVGRRLRSLHVATGSWDPKTAIKQGSEQPSRPVSNKTQSLIDLQYLQQHPAHVGSQYLVNK